MTYIIEDLLEDSPVDKIITECDRLKTYTDSNKTDDLHLEYYNLHELLTSTFTDEEYDNFLRIVSLFQSGISISMIDKFHHTSLMRSQHPDIEYIDYN